MSDHLKLNIKNMKLLVYIPAFNEEETIKEAIKAIPKNIDGVDSFDILVVDDGSTDRTAQFAKDAGAIVVSHGVNKNVGMAFRTALDYARDHRYEILVSIDADRQFNANQIPEIIKPILNNEANMVLGNRFAEGMPENMPKTKYWGNKQMSKLISFISKQTFRDVSCGFRAYGIESILRLNLFGKFTYTQETILDMATKGMRIVEFPVDVTYFKNGRVSRVAANVLSYAVKTLKIILRSLRDYKPMFFFGGSGGVSVGIGLLFIIAMFIHYFITGEFTPYKFFGFIGLGFLIWGALLFVIGLLADMMNRLRMNQERILYRLNKDRFDRK
ncbi:MAG: glycosyltransferase family 2 protein [Candidatus Dojkabacteria bacterium]|nr:glycosyltransferase family 2 protein [Candidatus Dojkabacteria bacterium]